MTDNRRGFTLLEVVTALAVIGLVAVSALATVGQQLKVAAHAHQIARAEELSAQRLAALRLLTTSQFRSLPDTMARGRFAAPDAGYTYHVVATPLLNDQDLSDVRIDIEWDGGSYALRTRMYTPQADTAS